MAIRRSLLLVVSFLAVEAAAQAPVPPAAETPPPATVEGAAPAAEPVVEVFQEPTSTPTATPEVVVVDQTQMPVAQQQVLLQPQGYAPQPTYSGRLHRERYEDGMAIPPGGRLVQRRKMGLVIPGAAMFGASYLSIIIVGASVGFDQLQGVLLVPVAGPFLALPEATEAARGGLIFLGALQLAGVAMFAAGMVERDYVEWYAGTEPGVRVAPSVSPDGAGLSLQGRF